MTLRAGYYMAGGAGEALPSSTETRQPGNAGYVFLGETGFFNVVFYKNEGWYAPGSVRESWVTVTLPSFVPPSGHTLTGVGFVVLQL